jgi:hypothetical protein
MIIKDLPLTIVKEGADHVDCQSAIVDKCFSLRLCVSVVK